jgi:ribosomal protein S18 acetylase RimI-like enzyme
MPPTPFLPHNADLLLRPGQYRDVETLAQAVDAGDRGGTMTAAAQPDWQQYRTWYGLLRVLRWFPNPLQHALCLHVAERDRALCGSILVEPTNCTRSTWRVKHVAVAPGESTHDIGSELLRYCFGHIWEARTWTVEVDVSQTDAMALYRRNGFQPLAQLTDWEIPVETLAALAQREADLPNFLPVGNADAPLLYQLDTAAMPPHVRQVFDRHMDDFRSDLLASAIAAVQLRLSGLEKLGGYVFEPQRKAAIGRFELRLQGDRAGEPTGAAIAHRAKLTVHPAYTWLYPELMVKMATAIARIGPLAPLQLSSSDYQPEREAYLDELGARRLGHRLLMSRSVWHKVRESRAISLEGLQDVLQGLQPAKPMAGRMFWTQAIAPERPDPAKTDPSSPSGDTPPPPQEPA